MLVYFLCVGFLGRLSSSSRVSNTNKLTCACVYVDVPLNNIEQYIRIVCTKQNEIIFDNQVVIDCERSNILNCCQYFVRDIERLCGIDSDYNRHVNFSAKYSLKK